MKATRLALALAAAVASSFGLAAEKTWNGTAGDSWSDGTKWEGGAPGAGDTAVIPSGATATVVTAADMANVNLLAGITLAAADSTIRFSTQEQTTMSCPVSGPGRYEVVDTAAGSSAGQFRINCSNMGFTGEFYFANSLVRILNNKALGWGPKITAEATHPDIASSVYALQYNATGTYSNDVVFTSSKKMYDIWTYNSIVNEGKFEFAGYAFLRGPNDGVSFSTVKGGVAHSSTDESVWVNGNWNVGGEIRTTHSSAPMVVLHTVKLLPDATWRGTVQVAGKIVFGAANQVLNSPTVLFGYNSDYGRTGTLDLNGFDQTFGCAQLYSEAKTPVDACVITSDKPATMTISVNSPGSSTLKASLRGQASLVYNRTDDTSNSFTLGAGTNTTSGMIGAYRWSFIMGEGAVFTDLSKIVATGNGRFFYMHRAEFQKPMDIVVTNKTSGYHAFYGFNDATITASTFKVDSGYLAPGTYSSANLAALINGTGKILVLSDHPYAPTGVSAWTGAVDSDIHEEGNWDVAPNWVDGWPTLAFNGGTDGASLSREAKVWGIGFARGDDFAIESGDDAALFTVASDGITTENTAADGVITCTIGVPVDFAAASSCTLGARTCLRFTRMPTVADGVASVAFESTETDLAKMPTVFFDCDVGDGLAKFTFDNVNVRTRTATWVGGAAVGNGMDVAENWEGSVLPDWANGWPMLNFAGGEEAVAVGPTTAWGLGFARGTDFTVSGSGARLDVGPGGIVAANTAGEGVITCTIDVPVNFVRPSCNTLGTGVRLVFNKTLTADAGVASVAFVSEETDPAKQPVVDFEGSIGDLEGRLFFTNVIVKRIAPTEPASWTGGLGADNDIAKAGNWDKLPNWQEGWPTLNFDGGANGASVNEKTEAWGIGFNRGTSFTIGSASAAALLKIGPSGITAANTAGEGVITNTIAVPIYFNEGSYNVLGERTCLQFASGLSSSENIGSIAFVSSVTDPALMPTVILEGDNSAMQTVMAFTNVNVVATNPWALGSATEGTFFSAANSARLRLTENVSPVTNNAALAIAGSLGQYPFTGKANEKVVQNGPLFCYAATLNGVVLDCHGGLYGVTRNSSGQALYMMSYTLNVYDVPMDMGKHIFHGEGGTVNLYVAGNKWTSYELYSNTLNCHVDGAFGPANSSFLVGYENRGLINLNGHDQIMTGCGVNITVNESTPKTRRLNLTSSDLAYLGLAANGSWPVEFQGKASPRVATVGVTASIVRQDSPTTGGIDVSAGTMVIKWDASFRNISAINVHGTGVLNIDATAGDNVFGATSMATLAVSDTGSISLGKDVNVRYLVGPDGKDVMYGTWGSQAACDAKRIDQEHVLPYLSGSGVLTVRRCKSAGALLIVR